MGSFVVHHRAYHSCEHCGRMLVQDDHLIIFIDAVGRFSIPVCDLRCTLMGFGSVRIFFGDVVIGEARLTDYSSQVKTFTLRWVETE